jgi:hypothetical protein
MLVLAGISATVSACDGFVYADGEQAALDEFRAVSVGESESGVVSALGIPTAVVHESENGSLLIEIQREGGAESRALDPSQRSSWPPEMRFIPSREIEGKVLIYMDGTVFAYYFIDRAGFVAFVDVTVS